MKLLKIYIILFKTLNFSLGDVQLALKGVRLIIFVLEKYI